MPILYVHGVNVRSRDGFDAMKPFARRYIAPAISDDPEGVLIDCAFWGKHAFDPKFGGASRPKTRLRAMGAGAQSNSGTMAEIVLEYRETLSRLPSVEPAPRASGGLAGSGLTAGGSPSSISETADRTLQELDSDELADLLATILTDASADPAEQAKLAIYADEMVGDDTARQILQSTSDPLRQIDLLLEEVSRRRRLDANLAGQGLTSWIEKIHDRFDEVFSRTDSAPAYALSYLIAELRPQLNDAVSRFLGDVCVYLVKRGTASAPGDVPQILMAKLRKMASNKESRGGEPLVVITHSMGGQLMYDMVTHFLPNSPSMRHIQVDFWCASASQVGFFEEGGLFIKSDPAHGLGKRVPYPPSNLGYWWNVWDHNDFLSFTASEIFERVDDQQYSSGQGLITAHGGYLQRPSFFRTMAAKIKAARDNSFKVI